MSEFIHNCTGTILAGGENRRMPVLKSFIQVNGRPIIEGNLITVRSLFKECLIVTNQPELYTHLQVSLIGDIYNIRGPMTGIFTSLINSTSSWIFVSACDMPFLSSDLITYMSLKRKNYDAVIPLVNGRLEPLFAFYSKKLLGSMEKSLLSDKRGLNDFLKDKKVQYISTDEIMKYDPGARSFINLNTPEDVTSLGIKTIL